MNILETTKYCIRCGNSSLSIDDKKVHCPHCDFSFYLNAISATGVLMVQGENLVCVKRNKEPGLGLLDFPGGFADPGETLERCAVREVREELGIELPIDSLIYLCSYPNTYVYKGITYYPIDAFFTAPLPNRNFKLQQEEIADVLVLPKQKLNKEDFAFQSHQYALDMYRKIKS